MAEYSITEYRDIELADNRIARVYHDKKDGMFIVDVIQQRDGKDYLLKTVYVDDTAGDNRITLLASKS